MRYPMFFVAVFFVVQARAAVIVHTVSDGETTFAYSTEVLTRGGRFRAMVESTGAELLSAQLSLMPSNNSDKGSSMLIADIQTETTRPPVAARYYRDTLVLDPNEQNKLISTTYSSLDSYGVLTQGMTLIGELASFAPNENVAEIVPYGHPMSRIQRIYRVTWYGEYAGVAPTVSLATSVPEPYRALGLASFVFFILRRPSRAFFYTSVP